jgi:hypothetical protein
MKKLTRYLIVSLAIILIFIGLGFLTYKIAGTPFPALEFQGGEISVYVGIGYTVEKYYPEISIDDPGDYTRSQFFLSFISIITYMVIFTAIQWIVAAIRKKSKQKT